jgi:hypothetical protein
VKAFCFSTSSIGFSNIITSVILCFVIPTSPAGEVLATSIDADEENFYSTGLFGEMDKKLVELEIMRNTMAGQNEDTSFIDERIEELRIFMQETKDEYEAMELDDGANRKRTRDGAGGSASEPPTSMKEYFTSKGQKFQDFLHDDKL